MPVRERRSEDDRPLFRAVNEQQLVRPTGMGSESQQEAGGAEGSQTTTQAGDTGQGEKGPIARAFDRAEENNWVYPSVASAARERGLWDKADEVLNRVRSQLGGG